MMNMMVVSEQQWPIVVVVVVVVVVVMAVSVAVAVVVAVAVADESTNICMHIIIYVRMYVCIVFRYVCVGG